MSILETETNVERLFNQKRDIIHCRRIRLNEKAMKTLIMIRMHIDKNEKLIILSIDFVISKFDTLNCDNTRDYGKNRKNINIYLNARLNQYSEVFENDNSVKNSD